MGITMNVLRPEFQHFFLCLDSLVLQNSSMVIHFNIFFFSKTQIIANHVNYTNKAPIFTVKEATFSLSIGKKKLILSINNPKNRIRSTIRKLFLVSFI